MPRIACRAPFVRTVIDRATRDAACDSIQPWVAPALLASALCAAPAAGCHVLDDWIAAFEIESFKRYNAVEGKFATAQRALFTLARGRSNGATRIKDLMRLETDRLWLSG